MSRLDIRNLLRAPLFLDIGCTRLRLQDGKSIICRELVSPLQPGAHAAGQFAELNQAISELFSALPPGRRVLEITLSDALARSWVAERLPGLTSRDEIDAVALDQMRSLYGDARSDFAEWVIRLDAEPFCEKWPAIALPKALLDLLAGLVTGRDFRPGRIQTRFVRSFNALRSHPFRRQNTAVYCLNAPDGLTIGIHGARQWQALRTHPPLRLLGADLPTMLRRDCRAAGVPIEGCRVHSLSWPAMEEAA